MVCLCILTMVDWLFCTHHHILLHILCIMYYKHASENLHVKVSNYNPYIAEKYSSRQALITNGPLCIFFLESAELGNPDGPLGTGKTGSFLFLLIQKYTLGCIHHQICGPFGTLIWACLSVYQPTLRLPLYVYVAWFISQCIWSISPSPSIRIPILNPKNFMVIKSEIRVVPTAASPHHLPHHLEVLI